jgi:hypothetical protein
MEHKLNEIKIKKKTIIFQIELILYHTGETKLKKWKKANLEGAARRKLIKFNLKKLILIKWIIAFPIGLFK